MNEEGLYRRLWQIQGELEDDLRGELERQNSTPNVEPDDLVVTGTPEGVGPLVAGDRVEVKISGVGLLSNRIAAR